MLNNREAAIVVNGEEISFQQFQQAYDNAYQRLSDQFGGNVPKGLAETFGIKQQVVNQLIQTALLRQGADEMGIVVSRGDIQNVIQNMTQFQENGVFNIERYKAILASNRMAPTKFEQTLYIDRLSELGARDIGGFASIATDFEIRDTYSQVNEKIELQYVKLSPANFTDQVELNDELLTTWFETVKDNYKTAPESKVSYITFTYAGIAQKLHIDSRQTEEYYQNNINDYKEPEMRHARHILLTASSADSTELHKEKAEKAAEILKVAQEGKNFVDLAKEFSEGPSKESGGDLGFFPAGSMVAEFNKAVLALQPGQISPVVKTQFGYHIILLEEVKPAQTRPMNDVTEEITLILQKKEAESLTFQLANSAYEGIISAGSLAKYTEQNPDVDVIDTDFFSRDDAPEDLQKDQLFLNAVFALNKGELSSLIKGQSGYAIIFTNDIKEPALPELAGIKTIVENDYKEAQSKELAKKEATDLLAGISDKQSLESGALEQGYEVHTSGLLAQNNQNQDKDFPASLLPDAFLLSSSTPAPESPGQVGDDFYVYTLLARQAPEVPEEREELAPYRANLMRFKKQQVLSAWLRNQEMKAEITQNNNL